jgi:hypothetical protein
MTRLQFILLAATFTLIVSAMSYLSLGISLPTNVWEYVVSFAAYSLVFYIVLKLDKGLVDAN